MDHDELDSQVGGPTVEDVLNAGSERRGCFTPLHLLALLAIAAVLAAVVPGFIRARAQGRMTACPSNLKNLGTACEMYSTDWQGKYPTSMALLTPNYLKTIPNCPAAGSITYQLKTGPNAAYNTDGFEDYYFLYCKGDNHKSVGIPTDYPQYDAIHGLMQR